MDLVSMSSLAILVRLTDDVSLSVLVWECDSCCSLHLLLLLVLSNLNASKLAWNLGHLESMWPKTGSTMRVGSMAWIVILVWHVGLDHVVQVMSALVVELASI